MTHSQRENGPDSTRGDRDMDEELEVLLADAEERVQRLRSELVRRRRERLGPDDLAAQHAEIARLSEHLENAQVNWQVVRDFFRSAIEEQRAGTPWGEPSSDQPDDHDRGSD